MTFPHVFRTASFRLSASTHQPTRKSATPMVRALAVCLLALSAALPAHANSPTVTFNGVLSVIASSGLPYPSGMAADKYGNIYTDANDGVQELVAVNGVVPVNPTIINIIPQYSNPYTGVFQYPKKLALDSSGNIYIADEGTNLIYEIKQVGGVFPSNPTPIALGSGFLNPYGVAVDAAGDVFVADTNHNAIKVMVAVSGAVPTTNPTINTINLGMTTCLQPESVAFDASGNLYTACTGSNTVLELMAVSGSIPAAPTVKTLGSGWNMGYGSDAQVDANGNVFVIDDNVNVGDIKEMLAVGGSIPTSPTIVTIATNLTQPNDIAIVGNTVYWGEENQSNEVKSVQVGTVGFGGVNVGSTSAAMPMSFSTGAGVTTMGNISFLTQGAVNLDFKAGTGSTCVYPSAYSANSTCTLNVTFTPTAAGLRTGAVQIVDNSSPANVLATVYISGTGVGPQVAYSLPSVVSIGSHPPLSQVNGVAVDGNGDVFAIDWATRVINEFVPSAGVYPASPTITFGSAADAFACGAVDGAGDLFIGDASSNDIIEYKAVGGVLQTGSYTSLGAGSTSFPSQLAFDANQNLYDADYGAHKVFMATAASNYTTFTAITTTGITTPWAIAIDAAGDLYVSDISNGTIKKIAAVGGVIPASPVITTLGVTFSSPRGLAIDAAGDLYVSDYSANTLTEIFAVNGVIPTSPVSLVIATGFNLPNSLTIDGKGNLYVADSSGSRIAKVDVADAPSLSFVTTNVGSTSTDSPKTVTIENNGNAALTFTKPSSGNNPYFGGTVPASYSLSSTGATACPLLTSSTSSTQTLAAGASCTLPISFTPTATSNAATLTIADNAQNVNTATQSITLSGAGTAVATLASFGITALPATGTAGAANGFTVTAYSGGTTVATSYKGTITLSSTQDANIALGGGGTTYTFTSGDAGVHTFTTTTGAVFQKAGTDTLTVTDTTANIAATSGNIAIGAAAASSAAASSGNGQSGAIGAALPVPLVVVVKDAYGNVVSGNVVTFTAPTTGASASLSASTCTTGTAGTCSVTATANGTASSTAYTVSAKATGVATAASFSLTNTVATPTLTVTAAPTTLVYGQPVTITATSVPASAGGSSPTGVVTFYANTTQLTTMTNVTPVNGVATFATAAQVGSQTYAASSAGDSNFSAVAKSSATAIVVGKAASTLAAPTTLPVYLPLSTAGTFNVSVNGQYSGTGVSAPSGSATYTIPSPCASGCTGTLTISSGAVTVPVPATLATGTYQVALAYAGDTNYNAATSLNVPLQIGPPSYTVTANPTTLTVTRGTAGTAVITFTPVNGYAGTATLTCSGLPAFASCLFLPTTVVMTGNNAVQTTTLSFYTLAPQAGAGAASSGLLWIPATLLGMLLLIRRRKLAMVTRSVLMLVVMALAAMSVTGCGWGTNGYSTPTGSNSVVVNVTATATAGTSSSNLNQAATITITVQ